MIFIEFLFFVHESGIWMKLSPRTFYESAAAAAGLTRTMDHLGRRSRRSEGRYFWKVEITKGVQHQKILEGKAQSVGICDDIVVLPTWEYIYSHLQSNVSSQ